MIALANDALLLRIDPDVGGGIASLMPARTEQELLFQAPWPIDQRALRGSGNEGWAAGWPGGWNLLFPNAGDACTVDGAAHGYHGATSVEPWKVLEASPQLARLRFKGAALVVERVVELMGHVVHVRTNVRNETDETRAFVAVEHVVFGSVLAAPGARVDRLSDAASEGDPAGERLVAPDAPGAWFRTDMTGGTSRTRVTAADGSVSAVVLARGFAALWLWAEQRSTRSAPWHGRASCLGIEPATSAVTGGLASAIEDGSSTQLPPRGEAIFEIELLVVPRE
jgi:hypothetical protein